MVMAAVVGASALIGAGTSLYGSSQASSAANKAANLQDARYQQTRADLQPYFGPGYNALSSLESLNSLGPTGGGPDFVGQAYANLPGNMSQAELEQTPGYQFDLRQGLRAVQGAAAARGLGISGASMKGAANFATGLANKTYLDQFNVRQKGFEDRLNLNTAQQGNLTNTYNRLSGVASMGANAAAGLGTTGAGLANAAGNYLNQAGQADAAGTRGVASAITGGANNYMAYDQYNKLMDKVGTANNPIYADIPGKTFPQG